jgi:hypothetical protein
MSYAYFDEDELVATTTLLYKLCMQYYMSSLQRVLLYELCIQYYIMSSLCYVERLHHICSPLPYLAPSHARPPFQGWILQPALNRQSSAGKPVVNNTLSSRQGKQTIRIPI